MLSYEEMENQDLIHLLVEGRDDQAFEVLYERHRSTVYFFLRKYYGHIEDVDDYFQLAAISLCEVCQDFQALGYSYSLFSALGRRIESRIIDQMRKQASKNASPRPKGSTMTGSSVRTGDLPSLTRFPSGIIPVRTRPIY
nr:sigma factor [Aerococcus tenax]